MPCHVLLRAGIHDYEFVEAYRLDGYEGQLAFNEQEVGEMVKEGEEGGGQ